jgi:hypothetical protein
MSDDDKHVFETPDNIPLFECIKRVECPPRIAPVSKLVNSRYTDFERSKEIWQGRATQRSRSSSFFVR